MKAIVGGTVFTPDQMIESGVVLMDGPLISAVGPASAVPVPDGAERIEAAGRSVVPGFVDVHVHGLLGHDVMGPGLSDAIAAFPRFGVTSFMATTLTLPREETLAALRSMAEQLSAQPPGARCLGIHIEGPFLSAARPGMANAAWVEPLAWDSFEGLQDAAAGWIRMATFAPEAGGAMGVIPRLVESGVIAVIGHSDATFDQAAEAIRLGVNHATHTYNAMRPLHHRDPGVVGAVMYFDQVFAELVADGIHVHQAAMAVLIRVKGLDRVVLISDAAPLAGLPPGEYRWGTTPVFVRDGRCELANGTIAGAHALIDSGVRRLVQEVGLPLAQALVPATRTAADSVGAQRKGRLATGCDADVVLLDDDLHPAMTFVAGELAWRRD